MDRRSKAIVMKWTANIGTVLSLAGGIAIFTFVMLGYFERDVLRVRGLVLALVLLGLGFVVRSEQAAYVPVPERSSR